MRRTAVMAGAIALTAAGAAEAAPKDKPTRVVVKRALTLTVERTDEGVRFTGQLTARRATVSGRAGGRKSAAARERVARLREAALAACAGPPQVVAVVAAGDGRRRRLGSATVDEAGRFSIAWAGGANAGEPLALLLQAVQARAPRRTEKLPEADVRCTATRSFRPEIGDEVVVG